MNITDPDRLDAIDSALLGSDHRDVWEIVAQAAHVAGTHRAAFSVLLARTQLYRAHVGLPAPIAASGGIDIARSPCRTVVEDGLPLTIVDATAMPDADAFFADCGVRSYAGVPIVYRGAVVGTLAVLDPSPRAFAEDLLASLEALAERLASALLLGRTATLRRFDTRPDPEVLEGAVAALADDLGARGGRLALAVSAFLARDAWTETLERADELLICHEEVRDSSARLQSILAQLTDRHATVVRLVLAELDRLARATAELWPVVRLAQAIRGGLIERGAAASSLAVLPPSGTLEPAIRCAATNVVIAARYLQRQRGPRSSRVRA